ncbi:cation-dependent mannose-6-phosphate receptor-like [Schistocerca cancellata]|uniref:cation-dependent mannose-6-phosphate receptor-like n=1 Tax=Schistocerca cancellata TaxID=274614 RepID=UPI0021197203|nr:cation-dependent mannose-6-phosphate receptor-like [Schistocerca cancellata]
MFEMLLKVATVCIAASVQWGSVSASINLPGCYIDLPADTNISTFSEVVGSWYAITHDSVKYSICVCCNVTPRDLNASVEAIPVSGSKKATVYGRRNCSHLALTEHWTLLQYHGGDSYVPNASCANGASGSRSTSLVIVCDTQESLSVVQADNCTLTMELRTPQSCVSPHQKIVPGLSHGSVFCILFAAVAGTYLLIGVGYRRLVCGAKGFDQIPNKDFWINLGHLQADGCNLVCRRGDFADGRSLSRSDGWQQIAGGSFTDSDRDDAPLQP